MPDTREQIIEQMARAVEQALSELGAREDAAYSEVTGEYPYPADYAPQANAASVAALPIAVRAVTARVRGLHREHQHGTALFGCDACFIVHGGQCAKSGACQRCGEPMPCSETELLDRIDAEWGLR